MTVHMIIFYVEIPDGNVQNAIDNWVQNHHEWEDDPQEHELVETEQWLQGSYRFTQEDESSELIDTLENHLTSVQGGLWYRIGYHICDHDEDDRDGCQWAYARDSGTVPSEVPEL